MFIGVHTAILKASQNKIMFGVLNNNTGSPVLSNGKLLTTRSRAIAEKEPIVWLGLE